MCLLRVNDTANVTFSAHLLRAYRPGAEKAWKKAWLQSSDPNGSTKELVLLFSRPMEMQFPTLQLMLTR
jgi:hypothetical protein